MNMHESSIKLLDTKLIFYSDKDQKDLYEIDVILKVLIGKSEACACMCYDKDKKEYLVDRSSSLTFLSALKTNDICIEKVEKIMSAIAERLGRNHQKEDLQ